jgi:Trypsin-like peptidase domain
VTLGLLKPKLPSQAAANAGATASQLERLLRDASPYVDFGRWIANLTALQGRVCRIEAEFYGTGLLVAPDLVLTNHHVVETEIKDKVRAKEVICRFDYSSTGGAGVREGREVGLADDWLVADAKYAPGDFRTGERGPLPDELDYSLIRLAEPAGDDTMGTKSRGVAVLQRDASQSMEKSIVQIVQHPKGSALAMSIGTVEGYDADRLRLRYAANTEGGSSGAPVLAPDLSVVALHHAGGPDWGDGKGYNQGIPIGLIVRHAEATPGVPRFWT